MFAMHLNQSYGSSVTYSALSSSPNKPSNHISQSCIHCILAKMKRLKRNELPTLFSVLLLVNTQNNFHALWTGYIKASYYQMGLAIPCQIETSIFVFILIYLVVRELRSEWVGQILPDSSKSSLIFKRKHNLVLAAIVPIWHEAGMV